MPVRTARAVKFCVNYFKYMSRIGKQLITIPDGVTISLQGNDLTVKGTKGTLALVLPESITLKEEDKKLTLTVSNEENKEERSLWGTWGSHVQNAVLGVTEGFQKVLEVSGVGYKVGLQGKKLELIVGYSHPVVFTVPDDITVSVDKNIITISGVDKQRVGQIAAEIRSIRKVEPYKGKGIKYSDEQVRRKAGKTAKSAA
jgi:large subunit ribosomal protein L6